MKIDLVKLRSQPPCDTSAVAPWLAQPTTLAARQLNMHEQQLKLWMRHGVGPTPIVKGTILKRHLWPADSERSAGFRFQVGRMVEFWERLCLPPDRARSFETICSDWRGSTLGTMMLDLYLQWESDDPETCPDENTPARLLKYNDSLEAKRTWKVKESMRLWDELKQHGRFL